MSENANPDHVQLEKLLEEAKALNLSMFPDQQKVWLAESPLAQEISRFSRNTRSIMTKSALSLATTFSQNQQGCRATPQRPAGKSSALRR